MREAGLIVDDATKHHFKDKDGGDGTHCLHCPRTGITIPFSTKAGLPTFQVTKPSMSEFLNWPEDHIIDIGVENWSPHEHQEESLMSTPPLEMKVAMAHTSTQANTAALMAFQEMDEDPCETFLNLNEFHDAQEEEEEDFFDAKATILHSGEPLVLDELTTFEGLWLDRNGNK